MVKNFLDLNEIYNIRHTKEIFSQKNDEILKEITKKLIKNEKNTLDPIQEIRNQVSNFYQFIKDNIVFIFSFYSFKLLFF